MQLPESNKLTTKELGNVFCNVTASYKFYWMLSILQIHAQTGKLKIDVPRILVRMVANAWYPIHYFKLSFGKIDSLFNIVVEVQRLTGIPMDSSVDKVAEELYARLNDRQIANLIGTLSHDVPYCYLTPWIGAGKYDERVARSQRFENGCLYAIHRDATEMTIELNSDWDDYLHRNYSILEDFIYWNLTLFIQKRNPNVPNIANKLIRPSRRSTLAEQRKCWNLTIRKTGPIKCIYTGLELHEDAFDLDHFMPWSFVSHDLMWNLIPADSSINSSKSNRLPDLSLYLPSMAATQHRMLKAVAEEKQMSKFITDYNAIGCNVDELVRMTRGEFLTVYRKLFIPLNQIASNMGFETWEYNTN
jgi:hypothetical protein